MSAILPTSQVIVYSARDSIVSLHLIPGAQIQSKFGIFKHDKMIGMKFGSKMKSDNGKGFVYLLKPTPELWYVIFGLFQALN